MALILACSNPSAQLDGEAIEVAESSSPPAVAAPAAVALPDFEAVEGPTRRGDLAPDGDLTRFDAPGSLRLADVLAQEHTDAALVVFMAHWCGACVSSLPKLQALQERHDRLEVVVYATDANRIGWQQTVEKVRASGLDGPVVIGAPYVQAAWLGESRAIPQYFFVDRAGRVVAHEHGYDEVIGARMDAHAESVLREG